MIFIKEDINRKDLYRIQIAGADHGGGAVGTAPSWSFKGGGAGPPLKLFERKTRFSVRIDCSVD